MLSWVLSICDHRYSSEELLQISFTFIDEKLRFRKSMHMDETLRFRKSIKPILLACKVTVNNVFESRSKKESGEEKLMDSMDYRNRTSLPQSNYPKIFIIFHSRTVSQVSIKVANLDPTINVSRRGNHT